MVLDLDVDVPAVVLGEGKGLLKGGDGQAVSVSASISPAATRPN